MDVSKIAFYKLGYEAGKKTNLSKKEAYEIVFNDLSKCGMFMGHYDGKNGSHKYMYGIEAVMGYIAYSVSEEVGDEFSTTFLTNMVESQKKGQI